MVSCQSKTLSCRLQGFCNGLGSKSINYRILGIPWSSDDPGRLVEPPLTLSGVQSQGQCKNVLNNCGRIGHWSNRWLNSITRPICVCLKRMWGAPFASVDRFHCSPHVGRWVVLVLFRSLVPIPTVTWHLTQTASEWAQRRLQNLALDLAIISHLPLRVKEKLILFPSIYVNTLLQSLNIGNSPTRGRSLFFFG